MSSPRTVSRQVRFGVRDLASCFYACSFPLVEEDSGNLFRKRSHKLKRTITFDFKGDTDSNEANKEIHVVKKSIKSSLQSSNNNTSVREEGERELPEPCFAEEDYIVFCFRKDGAIDMTSEGKTPSEEFDAYDKDDDDEDANYDCEADGNNNTLRPTNRKLHYGEHDDQNEQQNEGNNEMETKRSLDNGAKEIDPNDFERLNKQKGDSFESCDSRKSENSTSSFAFPVLSTKWIGSPVHMPRSQDHEAKCGRTLL